jgi:copper chaperone CopZ
MKKNFFIPALLLLLSTNLFSQNAKLRIRDFTPRYTISSFNVLGTCGLCTNRILHAMKVDGVKSAFWDLEDQQLTVQFDNRKVDLEQLSRLLAAAGHDTESFKADEDVYVKLPVCCHYNRTKPGWAKETKFISIN